MRISELDENRLSDTDKSNLLFNLRDDGQRGDCIVVLGSQKAVKYRVPKAVELYQAGRASNILVSGGSHWPGHADPEALEMKQALIDAGVPEDAILADTESRSTKENALCSLVVLDRHLPLHTVKRLLLVTTSFHMRRAYLTFRTYIPAWIALTLCPAEIDKTTRADTWRLNPNGIQRVEDECRHLIRHVKSGYLMDDEI